MPNQLSEYTAKHAQRAEKGDIHQFMRTHPEVFVERKYDGVRVFAWSDAKVLLSSKHNGVYGEADYPDIVRELSSLEKGTILDGELLKMSGELYVFDVLFVAGQDNRSKPLWSRKVTLEGILRLERPHVHLVPAKFCTTKESVLSYYDEIVGSGGEGVVVKDVRAPYSATPGAWLKVKHRVDIDVFVSSVKLTEGGRREFEMGLYDGDGVRYVGDIYNADGSVNRNGITEGSVLRVKYLPTKGYHYLRDPIIMEVRTDKLAKECTVDQL